MDQDKPQSNQASGQGQAQPQVSSGTVTIAGEKVDVNTDAVPSSPPSPSEEIIKSLKEASEKGVFPQPPSDSDE